MELLSHKGSRVRLPRYCMARFCGDLVPLEGAADSRDWRDRVMGDAGVGRATQKTIKLDLSQSPHEGHTSAPFAGARGRREVRVDPGG
eukprot:3517135-Pyramimonas_sp.AAC.2